MNDKEQISYITCQTSASHTYGNLTAFIQQWLVGLYPKESFKTIHVSSKIAHRQLISTGKTFLKKPKPVFVIRPRVDWTPSDTFLNGSLVTSRTTDIYSSYGDSNLQEFIRDSKNKYTVKYQLNRQVMTFDVVMIFSTLMQQMNFAQHTLNVTRHEKPFDLDTILDSYVPEEMMEIISKLSGVPLKDENGSVKDFVDYLNGVSKYPISYKLQGGTGTYEFYRHYPVKIDTIAMGFSADDGSRNGHITSDYQLSFTLRCEFNTSGYYFLFSDKIDSNRTIMPPSSDVIIPIFTDMTINEDINLSSGWSIYNTPICRLEDPNDSVDITGVFNSSILYTIDHHLNNAIPTDLFLNFRIRAQGNLLTEGKDYTIDLKNRSIRFINCSTYPTYKIIVILNVQYVNELIKEKFKLG